MEIFYDGKKVEEGEVLLASTQVTENNICVLGVKNYAVEKSVNGNKVTFTVTYEGESFVFAVQENIVNEIPAEKEGCSSSLSLGGMAITLALAAIISVRRKRHE